LPAQNHYTTARDLCYIARYAIQNPVFGKIVSTKCYQPRNWVNKNKMLYECEGAIGVKTGYTKEAGRCLVSAVKRGNMTIISTVLDCSQMYERSMELINSAFETYTNTCLMAKGTVLPILQGKTEIKGKVDRDYFYPLSEGEKAHIEIHTRAFSPPKMEKIIGQFGIYLSKRLLFSGNLYKL
jgi:D-alanyl-D-alanine carboxypeptidase (penicillin-binding protein 5/6)